MRLLRNRIPWIGLLIALPLLSLPLSAVLANPVDPGTVTTLMWFTFRPDASWRGPARPEGFRMLACKDSACDTQMFVQGTGDCSGRGCVDITKLYFHGGPYHPVRCGDDICRFGFYWTFDWNYTRVVAQFRDGVRSSPIMDQGAHAGAWNVTVGEDELSMYWSSDYAGPDPWSHNLLAGLALALVVELAVAALYTRRRYGPDRARLLHTLLMVFLINLATIPVVWVFFPSLGHFMPLSFENAGQGTLAAAALYCVLLVWTSRAGHEKARFQRFIASALLLGAAVLLITGCALFFSGFSDMALPMPGLSRSTILISSELFAVFAEAALLHLLSRGALSWGQSAGLSLLLNGASLVAGLLVLGY